MTTGGTQIASVLPKLRSHRSGSNRSTPKGMNCVGFVVDVMGWLRHVTALFPFFPDPSQLESSFVAYSFRNLVFLTLFAPSPDEMTNCMRDESSTASPPWMFHMIHVFACVHSLWSKSRLGSKIILYARGSQQVFDSSSRCATSQTHTKHALGAGRLEHW